MAPDFLGTRAQESRMQELQRTACGCLDTHVREDLGGRHGATVMHLGAHEPP
jgi:hypothetical protein